MGLGALGQQLFAKWPGRVSVLEQGRMGPVGACERSGNQSPKAERRGASDPAQGGQRWPGSRTLK